MRDPGGQEHRLTGGERDRNAIGGGLHENGAVGDHRLFGPGMGMPATTCPGFENQALDVEGRLFAIVTMETGVVVVPLARSVRWTSPSAGVAVAGPDRMHAVTIAAVVAALGVLLFTIP